MKDVPVVPIARGETPKKLGSFTVPEGTTGARRALVEGRPVVVLITGLSDGHPHEVAVQDAGTSLGEKFFIRISDSTGPADAPVYGPVGEKMINACAELPQGLPQVGGQTASAPRPVSRVETGTLLRENFEPPVEKKNTDGNSQFELRIHNKNGTDTMVPITPHKGAGEPGAPLRFLPRPENA